MTTFSATTVQIAPALDGLRIFLHVIGATIWVGGQFTLAALVPILRKQSPELPRVIARAFNKIGWPAFALLVITGFWNLTKIPSDAPKSYHAVVGIKMTVVLLSGAAAYLHSRSKNPKSIAIWGSVSGLAAIGATYVGVLLAG
jgi:putative copper export protein